MKQFLIIICLFISCIAPAFSISFTAEEIKKCYEDYISDFENYDPASSFNITQKGNNVYDGSTYDYIVVGAGSSGCAMANALAKSGRVLLLGRGSEASKCSRIPFFKKYLQFNPASVTLQSAPNGQCFKGFINNKINIKYGSGIGGASTNDDMTYYKISDDEITKLNCVIGPTTWTSKLREVMRDMESADVFTESDSFSSSRSACHGEDGPIPVKIDDVQSPAAKEFIRSTGKCDVDFNCGKAVGCGKFQVMSDKGVRLNILDTFNIKNNKKITLRKNVYVTKLELGSSNSRNCEYRAKGVYYVKDEKLYKAKANKAVVVTSGSVFSPKILLSSGIGKCSELKEKNIACKYELPVGHNQVDIPQVRIILKTNCKQKLDITDDDINQYLCNGTGMLSSTGKQGTCYVNFKNGKTNPDVQYHIRYINTDDGMLAKSLNMKPHLYTPWLKHFSSGAYMLTISVLKPSVNVTTSICSSNPFSFPCVRYTCSKNDRDTLVRAIKHFKYNIAPHFSSCKVEVPVQIPSLCDSCESDDDDDCIYRFVENTMTFKGSITGGCNMGTVTDSTSKVIGSCNLYVTDSSSWPIKLNGNLTPCLFAYAKLIADAIIAKTKHEPSPGSCSCSDC